MAGGGAALLGVGQMTKEQVNDQSGDTDLGQCGCGGGSPNSVRSKKCGSGSTEAKRPHRTGQVQLSVGLGG